MGVKLQNDTFLLAIDTLECCRLMGVKHMVGTGGVGWPDGGLQFEMQVAYRVGEECGEWGKVGIGKRRAGYVGYLSEAFLSASILMSSLPAMKRQRKAL